MSAITYDTINIVGVPYSKLLTLEITHFPNQHGTAKMTGLIPYADAMEFTQRVDETFAIDITTSAEGQPSKLFYGLVTNLVHAASRNRIRTEQELKGIQAADQNQTVEQESPRMEMA